MRQLIGENDTKKAVWKTKYFLPAKNLQSKYKETNAAKKQRKGSYQE